jgi:hypothetical protein
MYFKYNVFVNCFQSKSYCVGAVFVVPLCLPIRAMFLLKSPSRIMLFCRLLWMWLNIVVSIVGMWMISSICIGIYRYIREYVVSR